MNAYRPEKCTEKRNILDKIFKWHFKSANIKEQKIIEWANKSLPYGKYIYIYVDAKNVHNIYATSGLMHIAHYKLHFHCTLHTFPYINMSDTTLHTILIFWRGKLVLFKDPVNYLFDLSETSNLV